MKPYDLSYVRQGKGRIKLVFIHGNLASSRWWGPALSELESLFDMVAVDLKGYGESQPGNQVVTLADHADDVAALIRKLAFTDCILIGHSLGGAVAMMFAERYPQLVTGLVLVDSAPVDGMSNINYSLLEEVVAQEDLLVASLRQTFIIPADPELWTLLADDCRKAKASFIPNTRALDRADFRGIAPLFVRPVLVIHGKLDPVISPEEAQKLAKAYPHSQLSLLTGVGHNPQVESPALFAATLKSFVKSLGDNTAES